MDSSLAPSSLLGPVCEEGVGVLLVNELHRDPGFQQTLPPHLPSRMASSGGVLGNLHCECVRAVPGTPSENVARDLSSLSGNSLCLSFRDQKTMGNSAVHL